MAAQACAPTTGTTSGPSTKRRSVCAASLPTCWSVCAGMSRMRLMRLRQQLSIPNRSTPGKRWPMSEHINIRPSSMVWQPQCGAVLEFESPATDPGVDQFVLPLGAGFGFVWFVRLPAIKGQNQAVFQSRSMHPVLSPALGPLASVQGVLWSRPAAREADRAIAAFLLAEGPIPESSAPGGL